MKNTILNSNEINQKSNIKGGRMSIKELSNIFGAETIKKIYGDGLSEPTQEIGKILTDFVKAFRLITAPIQLLSSYQDRLVKYLKKITDSVPVDKRIECPSYFSGPIIERLIYLEEDNYLTDFYLNLLSKAINKEKCNLAHPAFPNIIHQLSPDEVLILEELKERPIKNKYEFQKNTKGEKINDNLINSTFNISNLSSPDFYKMYIDHLQLLNLVWIKADESPNYNTKKHKFTRTMRNELSDFGKLFLNACSKD